MCDPVLVAGDCVHTRLPHSFKENAGRAKRGARERKREEGADRARLGLSFLFPAIDRINIRRYLQCTYCSFLLSLSFFLFFPLFFHRRVLVPFLSWVRSLAICLLCRLYLTATETSHVNVPLPHNTSSCIFSPWSVGTWMYTGCPWTTIAPSFVNSLNRFRGRLFFEGNFIAFLSRSLALSLAQLFS